jgi:hypothetical protein
MSVLKLFVQLLQRKDIEDGVQNARAFWTVLRSWHIISYTVLYKKSVLNVAKDFNNKCFRTKFGHVEERLYNRLLQFLFWVERTIFIKIDTTQYKYKKDLFVWIFHSAIHNREKGLMAFWEEEWGWMDLRKYNEVILSRIRV